MKRLDKILSALAKNGCVIFEIDDGLQDYVLLQRLYTKCYNADYMLIRKSYPAMVVNFSNEFSPSSGKWIIIDETRNYQ